MDGNKRSDEQAGKARGIQNEWGDCDAIADVLAGRQFNYSRLVRQIMMNCARELDVNARKFDFQVKGILYGHVRDSLPGDKFNI